MQRIHEGLNMKQWKCANRKCKHFNLEESTLRCKKCQTPRPFKTLPKDLVFPLYLPMNEKIRDNELAMVFSQVLYFVPNVKIQEDFEEVLKQAKTKEKNAKHKDFNKIKMIEDFLVIRDEIIKTERDSRQ